MAQEVCYFSKKYNSQDETTSSSLQSSISTEYLKRQQYLQKYKYFTSIDDFKSVEMLLKQRKAIAEDIDHFHPNQSDYSLEAMYELLDYINDLIRNALGL